ncbi:hypothetical protein J2Z31_002620, partial [Sinorhizobium kostiense]|nr:hypothetical protein [Sinorhizobium kostiense]
RCQSLARAQWLEDRRAELLDTQYFHVVFTLPEAIAAIAYQNKALVYGLLFRATAETLRTIAADPRHLGAEIGFFAVLHSWGQNLLHHPHLHCVVPGGGFSPDGERWIACKPGFFLPVRVLSRLFRRLFLQHLEKAFDAGKLQFFTALQHLSECKAFRRYLAPVRKTDWVVYAKPPFAGPEQVLDYVGRYTHRVAISNNRLVDIEDGAVRFRWKDYRHGDRQKVMTVSTDEFIRRFLLHVLPEGFHRIRYYGFLGNRYREQKLAHCRDLLGMPIPEPSQSQAPKEYRDRGAHRAFPQAMPGLSSRADDHHRNLRRRHRTAAILGYVMKEAHRFHRHRSTVPPETGRSREGACRRAYQPFPAGHNGSLYRYNGNLYPCRIRNRRCFRPVHPAAAHVNTAPATPFLGAALFNTHRT